MSTSFRSIFTQSQQIFRHYKIIGLTSSNKIINNKRELSRWTMMMMNTADRTFLPSMIVGGGMYPFLCNVKLFSNQPQVKSSVLDISSSGNLADQVKIYNYC